MTTPHQWRQLGTVCQLYELTLSKDQNVSDTAKATLRFMVEVERGLAYVDEGRPIDFIKNVGEMHKRITHAMHKASTYPARVCDLESDQQLIENFVASRRHYGG